MRKKLVLGVLTVALSLGFSLTSLAGQWKQDSVGWWYDNGNGTYPANQWQWIDGNGDGIAECYYFDHSGYCMIYTITPDGYQVNSAGAWIVSGQVQTRNIDVKQNFQIQSGQDESAKDTIVPLLLYDETPVSKMSAYCATDAQTNKEHDKWIKVLTFFPDSLGSNMEYYAGGKYNSFKATVAPRMVRAWDENDYMYLEIYGDDNLLYRSDEIIYKTSMFDVDVDISDCDMVDIVCIGKLSPDPVSMILKNARFE